MLSAFSVFYVILAFAAFFWWCLKGYPKLMTAFQSRPGFLTRVGIWCLGLLLILSGVQRLHAFIAGASQ